MKQTIFNATLIACAAGMLLCSGVAIAQQGADETAADVDQAEAKTDKARHECVRVTGSRICRDPDTLERTGRTLNTAHNVSVYTRRDLDATGRPTTADALRALDPSLR